MKITMVHSISVQRVESFDVPDELGRRLLAGGVAPSPGDQQDAWDEFLESDASTPVWYDDDEKDAHLILIEEQQREGA